MDTNEIDEDITDSNDKAATVDPAKLEQIKPKSDAILSELRRLHFKITLVMGLLVFIVFGVWN